MRQWKAKRVEAEKKERQRARRPLHFFPTHKNTMEGPHLHAAGHTRLRVLAAHLDPGRACRPLATAWGGGHCRVQAARTRADEGATATTTAAATTAAAPHRPAIMSADEAVADIKDEAFLVVRF